MAQQHQPPPTGQENTQQTSAPSVIPSGRPSQPPETASNSSASPQPIHYPDYDHDKLGRPTMLAPEEKLARQRARNRQSAMRARQRKKEQDKTLTQQLESKTAECVALEEKCKGLEKQVSNLMDLLKRTEGLSPRAIRLLLPAEVETALASAPAPNSTEAAPVPPTEASLQSNVPMPVEVPGDVQTNAQGKWWNTAPSPAATPISFLRGAPQSYPATTPTYSPQFSNPAQGQMETPAAAQATQTLDTIPDLTNIVLPETFAGGDDYEFMSLSTLFGFDVVADADVDDANDTDFVPPTSPKAGEDDSSDDEGGDGGDDGDDDGDGDGDGDEDDEDHRRKRRRVDDTDDFIPETDDAAVAEASDEEEDLFLPIEDVPVPVDQLYRDAMEALGVSTQAELVAVVGRMVDAASKGHVTPEEVEGIRRLMRLAEAQGMYRSGS